MLVTCFGHMGPCICLMFVLRISYVSVTVCVNVFVGKSSTGAQSLNRAPIQHISKALHEGKSVGRLQFG